MSDYQLLSDVHVHVTPAGAYYAASAQEDEAARRLLHAILAQPRTPLLDIDSLCRWSGQSSRDDALALLHRMQVVGWLRGADEARDAPGAHLEQDMPALLARLSASQRALLADEQGLTLALSGFSHEAGEQLAALAAEFAALHRRYRGVLHGNLRLNVGGVAAVDAAGNAQLGTWPLYIGGQAFLLVIAGLPLLHGAAFSDTVWGLTRRYAAAS